MSGFFAVGLAEWREACKLGLNPAVSFLILACGSGRDNETTSWSSTSVATYGGIAWVRAKPAIDLLIGAGLLTTSGPRTKPRYKLRISEEKIWLPKSIVIPLADELPAVRRIREMQDVMTLRLFVELYYAQNLAADGGLSRAVYYKSFTKAKYCEKGSHTFFGFDDSGFHHTTWDHEVTAAHRIELSKADIKAGKGNGEALFARFQTLRNLGLLEYSVCLFESKDKEAEILFPVDGPTADEKRVGQLADEAASRVLLDWQCSNNPHEYLIPLLRHHEKADLFGIYRLRHRPQTRLTGAWWGILQDKMNKAVDGFDDIGS